MVSEIDLKRNKKKFNVELTNAITDLSKAAGSLNRYLHERKRNEKYGTEEA